MIHNLPWSDDEPMRTITVRMPRSLHLEITTAAHQKMISLNRWCVGAFEAALNFFPRGTNTSEASQQGGEASESSYETDCVEPGESLPFGANDQISIRIDDGTLCGAVVTASGAQWVEAFRRSVLQEQEQR